MTFSLSHNDVKFKGFGIFLTFFKSFAEINWILFI